MAKTNEPLEAIKKTQTAPVSDRKQLKVNGTQEVVSDRKQTTPGGEQTDRSVTGSNETGALAQTVTEQQEETEKEVVKEAAEQGKTADIPENKKASAKDKKDDKIDAFIAPYRKAYPAEKAFHVTSDRQVFLEKDRGLAVLHQNSLDNGELVQTIKVK